MESGRLGIEQARYLDRICDIFEADLHEGRRARIETYLPEVSANLCATLLRLLLDAELDFRRSCGERPTPNEYHARFPEHAGLIESAFATGDHPDHRPAERSRPPASYDASARPVPIVTVSAVGRPRPIPGTPTRPRQLRFITGGGDGPVTIDGLLRARLLFLSGLIAVLMLALVAFVDLGKFRSPRPEISADGRAYTGSHLAMAAVALALIPALRSKRAASLRHLRTIEFILFGALCAEFSWIQWHEFFDPLTRQFEGVSGIAASAASLGWVVIIVFYGTFIPTDWGRCAVAVSLIALCPLLTAFAASAASEEVRWFVFGPFLVYLTLWMTLAGAIVTFGAHRIDVLQQEATEARRLGQYRLKRLLKSGGMGDVYLAEHMLLRRPCAIKLIRPERAGDPEYIQLFEREVRAMARLNHWNTVQIFDYGLTDDGTFYYAMEYLPGLNLHEMIQRYGPLPPGRVIHFLRQICNALREAHSMGLIHRDIKPSNILACRRGGLADVVKLLDFGLVRQIGRAVDVVGMGSASPGSDAGMTLPMSRVLLKGTPAYMSPEQIKNPGLISDRSDIYAVGALAYDLLTGAPPFVRSDLDALLDAHVHEEAEPPSRRNPGIPADLDRIILRCLAKDPNGRWPDVQALEAALAGCRCAGDWSDEMAVEWWEANVPTDPSELEVAPTAEANGAVSRGPVSCVLENDSPTADR
jgi:serine/threonine-protein kinase